MAKKAEPATPPANTAALVAGSFLIGLWLMLAAVTGGGPDQMVIRAGAVGVLIAGVAYSMRFAPPVWRTPLAVLLGLGLAVGLFALVALAASGSEGFLAVVGFALAVGGGIIIANAMPVPQRSE